MKKTTNSNPLKYFNDQADTRKKSVNAGNDKLVKAQAGKIVKSVLSPEVTASLARKAGIVSKAKKAQKVYGNIVLGGAGAAAGAGAGLAGYTAYQAVKNNNSKKPVVKSVIKKQEKQ